MGTQTNDGVEKSANRAGNISLASDYRGRSFGEPSYHGAIENKAGLFTQKRGTVMGVVRAGASSIGRIRNNMHGTYSG